MTGGMNTICDRLLGQLFLWHTTDSEEKANSISEKGFRSAMKQGVHRYTQATWFYHVTAFGGGAKTVGPVTFLVGVDPDNYVRGRDYFHDNDNTVVFQVSISSDRLLAKLDLRQVTNGDEFAKALGDRWQCDVVSEFTECFSDPEIPWSQKTRMAEMLWRMAPARYFEAGVPHQMLVAEVPGLSSAESVRLVLSLRKKCLGFLNTLLRLYHQVFLTPRLGRATMVAAAKYLEPVRILDSADGSAIRMPSSAVAEFVDEIQPRLPSDDLVRGAIEMASMRHFPGNEQDIERIGDWVEERARIGGEIDSEETAFHYIMFGGDTYPTRHSPSTARSLAVRILRASGRDYFDRLLGLGDTDSLETLSGVMHAFGGLGEKRAVPFLASRLKDDRKMGRVAAVRALGEIGTREALTALRAVANDRRKVVQKALQRALGDN